MRSPLLTVTLCVISFTALFAQDSIVAKFVARSHSLRGGVFFSSNSGANWSAVNTGLPANSSFLACAISGGHLIAGTDVGGIFLSTDNGTNWNAASPGLTSTEIRAFAVGGTNLFAGTNGDGVFRSTDNGTTWTAASNGLTAPYVRALAVNGTNLVAGTAGFGGGVFVSTDSGTSWRAASDGLTSTSVFALAASGANLFAGTFGAGVYVSTDNGTSWNVASTGLTNRYVNALAVNGTNLFAGTGGGVYLSTNSGASWTSINDGIINYGLDNNTVFALAVAGSDVFAGSGEGGVYRSTNSGASWTVVSPGLTNTNVNALAVSGTSLFAGTDQGVTLPYRLFIPDNYLPSKKYPLVLTLAGSGGGGTDNLLQMDGRVATSWADPVNQAKYPCFVVSPQASANRSWSDDDISGTVSDLLDSLQREFTIDSNRLYVTGFSLGGTGSWYMITRFPDRFAAAIPMSGGWYSATVLPSTHTPVWDFQGALDLPILPYARNMIDALKAIGRSVVYTQCHNSDCTGMPDSSVDMYVMSHADLFYSEYQFEEHGPWDMAYDDPLLYKWVFDKYRLTPGAITISNLRYHQTLRGIATVSWQSSAGGDSVEIWNSPDAGRTWQIVSRSAPNGGNYQWNTLNVKDGGFELLKVFVKNHEGFIYGQDQSSYFSIDNAINGTPFVKILNEEFTTDKIFNQDTLTLNLLVGDSKSVPLTVRLYYSTDGGQNFNQFDSYTTTTDTVSRARLIHLAALGNSVNAVIKAQVDDGKSTSSDQTFPFNELITSVANRTGGGLPGSFTLEQNYPNPFNPTTNIRYGLPHNSNVTLKVFNTLGQQVAVLVHGDQEAGYHEVRFDGSRLASGVYLYRIQAGTYVATKKILLLR